MYQITLIELFEEDFANYLSLFQILVKEYEQHLLKSK